MFSVSNDVHIEQCVPIQIESKPQYTGNKPKMQKDTKDIYC